MIIFFIQLSQSCKERLKARGRSFCLLCSQESTFCSIWCSFIVFILEPSHKAPFSLPPPPQINWKETIQSSAWGEQLILLNTCPDCDCCTIIACPMVAFSFRRTLKMNYQCQGILLKHRKKNNVNEFPFLTFMPRCTKNPFLSLNITLLVRAPLLVQ